MKLTTIICAGMWLVSVAVMLIGARTGHVGLFETGRMLIGWITAGCFALAAITGVVWAFKVAP